MVQKDDFHNSNGLPPVNLSPSEAEGGPEVHGKDICRIVLNIV